MIFSPHPVGSISQGVLNSEKKIILTDNLFVDRQSHNEKMKTTCRMDSLEYVVRTSHKNVSCGYVKECLL